MARADLSDTSSLDTSSLDALTARLTWGVDHLASGAICVTAPAHVEALPLPAALMTALPTWFPTTSAAKKACRRGCGPYSVELSGGNGRCVTTVNAGDTFTVVPAPKAQRPALAMPFLDEHIAVVHKPPGLVLHGAGEDNLSARLLAQLGDGVDPCHRLDAPTEGLLVCGRTKAATARLSNQFERRSVRKRYVAVVHGALPADTGLVDSQIDGQDARTEYRVRW